MMYAINSMSLPTRTALHNTNRGNPTNNAAAKKNRGSQKEKKSKVNNFALNPGGSNENNVFTSKFIYYY